MDIKVLDKDFNVLDIIEDYVSSIWDIKYSDYSNFELYLPATVSNVSLLTTAKYLVRDIDVIDGKMYNVMQIKKLTIVTDIENGDYITVTGYCLKKIIAQRIIWQQTTVRGSVETAIAQLVRENAIAPVDRERTIEGLIMAETKGLKETISKQLTGDNLADAIIDICNTYGLGWRVYVDVDKKMVIEIYKGLDRSDSQDVNERVTFSSDADTLLTSSYTLNKENYKNVALVAGEGEGLARKTKVVGVASGLERYEIYVDAKDQSSNDGEITNEEYNEILNEKGLEELEATKYNESFEGEVETQSNHILGIDYNIGDIVNVQNEYGITATPRVIGVIDSHSDTGRTTIPTFSTWKGDE